MLFVQLITKHTCLYAWQCSKVNGHCLFFVLFFVYTVWSRIYSLKQQVSRDVLLVLFITLIPNILLKDDMIRAFLLKLSLQYCEDVTHRPGPVSHFLIYFSSHFKTRTVNAHKSRPCLSGSTIISILCRKWRG